MSIFVPGTLEAIGLTAIRTSALVLVAPVLAAGVPFQSVKAALIVMLTGVIYLSNGAPLDPVPGSLEFVLLALRELGIGMVLAMALEIGVVGVRVGAELIGHEMTFTMAQVVDPESGHSKPVLSQFYENLFLVLVFAADGHHWLVRALGASTERAPIGELTWSAGPMQFGVQLLSDFFQAGISFAAPVLVFLALVSALVGLLSRAVPQLNVIEFGFNLRVLLGLTLMFLFAPLLTPALSRLLELVLRGVETSLEAIG